MALRTSREHNILLFFAFIPNRLAGRPQEQGERGLAMDDAGYESESQVDILAAACARIAHFAHPNTIRVHKAE